MNFPPTNKTQLPIVYKLGFCAVILSLNGCAAANNLIQGLSHRYEEHQELAEERHELRHSLAEQRREERRFAAEQEQYERDFCLARQEALQRHIKGQVRDQVAAKVAFDVTSGFEVGELEVDQEALKKILDDRDREAQRGPAEPQRGPTCGCYHKECGCHPHLQKRHCPRCRHKRCDHPEPGCGGPEALQRITEAQRRPLRPAEIPLKLPVRLTFGMEAPEIEEAKIRREPLEGPEQEPFRKGPCDDQCPLQKSRADVPQPPAPVPDDVNLSLEANDGATSPILSARYFSKS